MFLLVPLTTVIINAPRVVNNVESFNLLNKEA